MGLTGVGLRVRIISEPAEKQSVGVPREDEVPVPVAVDEPVELEKTLAKA